MTLVPELRRQIALLQKRIESIQDDCSHPDSAVTKTARSDTGNYDRSQDEYWNDCECLLCLKRWREKQ